MNEDRVHLLVDGHHGIYVPKVFSESFVMEKWGLTEDYSQLTDPENLYYWDTWDEVLRDAEMTDKNGDKWWLHQQDGDLFAVRADFTEEEWEERFGV